MRKHKIIRQEIVGPSQTFLFDIETEQFDNIMATWSVSSDATAAPSTLIFCPTIERRSAATANFAGVPAAPAIGNAAYCAVGANMGIALPIPAMVTIGVITPAGCTVTIRVEGDEHENLPLSDNEKQRSRS
jgi:hypothetical protein